MGHAEQNAEVAVRVAAQFSDSAQLKLAAAQALAELTGEIAPEEVLNAIFDTFCIGK